MPGRAVSPSDIEVDLPRPRDVSSVEFNALRREITQGLSSHLAPKKLDAAMVNALSDTTQFISSRIADAVYRGMDREALTKAYDNSGAVSDSPVWLQRWRERSEALRRSPVIGSISPTAAGERQKIDYFSCGITRTRRCLCFCTADIGSATVATCSPSLPRAPWPAASMLPSWVIPWPRKPGCNKSWTNAAGRSISCSISAEALTLGFDPRNVIVGGWSAGGHLAAALLTGGEHRIKGALSISGIFDLEPIALCALNDKLGLSREDAMRLSPCTELRRRSRRSTPCTAKTNCMSCKDNR